MSSPHMVAGPVIAPYGDLVARTRDRDACPGALQLHHAADGALARVRLPGGMILARQLEELAHAAARFGSPGMELTSRGNIQLLAIADTAAVADIAAGGRLTPPAVVPAIVAVATRFSATRGRAWRVAELADVTPLLEQFTPCAAPGATWPPVVRPPVGWLEQDDGRVALGAAVPLGVLPASVAEYLAAIGAPLVITPWRSVLVCDLDEGVADVALRVLAPMGLVFDGNSPWLTVSACTGSPGCEHSAADVRADATAALDEPADGHRHFVGCERACGSPPVGEVLVATGDGYRLRAPHP